MVQVFGVLSEVLVIRRQRLVGFKQDGAGLLLGIAAGRFLKASSNNRYYTSRRYTQTRPLAARPAQDTWDTQPLPPTTPSLPSTDPTIVTASR